MRPRTGAGSYSVSPDETTTDPTDLTDSTDSPDAGADTDGDGYPDDQFAPGAGQEPLSPPGQANGDGGAAPQ